MTLQKKKQRHFNDLSAGEKQKLIDSSREDLLYEDWWENVYHDAKRCAVRIGIAIDNIYFSGFSSQGDGACLTGRYAYERRSIEKIKRYAPKDKELHQIAIDLAKIQKPTCYGLFATIKHQGRYNHEHCTIVTIADSHNETTPSYERQDALAIELRNFMCWIYKCLEKEHDYLTSDEAISEWLSNNYLEV